MNAVDTNTRCARLNRDSVLHNARRYWMLRRTQDVFLSVLALLILWPWMLLIALIIIVCIVFEYVISIAHNSEDKPLVVEEKRIDY